MNLRRVASLTACLAFMVMVLTSIILYIMPQGRVAYWADWRLFGLGKEQWGALHINTGILFFLSLGLHLYYNWHPLVNYLKNNRKQLQIFTREGTISLLLVGVCLFGTFMEIAPFSTIIEGSDNVKARAAQKYGEPPYGHAELSSLKSFSQKMRIEFDDALAALHEADIEVRDSRQSLQEIGRNNSLSPQEVFNAIQHGIGSSSPKVNSKALPERPLPGTGNMSISDICRQYGLNAGEIIQALAEANISAQQEMTMKEVAGNNNTSPIDIYELIRSTASANHKE